MDIDSLRQLHDLKFEEEEEEETSASTSKKRKQKRKEDKGKGKEKDKDKDKDDRKRKRKSSTIYGEEEDRGKNDTNEEMRKLLETRVTTFLMLSLSFESNYPKEFYERIAEMGTFEEVTQRFTKPEMQSFNRLMKDQKKNTQKRIQECTKPSLM